MQHNSMVARENRHKRIDDAEKRRQYRIAHGMEEPQKAASPVVEDDQSPIAPAAVLEGIDTQASVGEGAAEQVNQQRPAKKWLGIW